jgi:transposase
MTRQARTTFSAEFKREAVRLFEQGDKEAAQLARELGVRRNQLYKWQKEIHAHGEAAFPGQGRRNNKSSGDDTRALKADLQKLREENEILKKAAIYFARESG